MKRTMRLTIPLETVSQNRRDHMHWGSRSTRRSRIERLLREAWLNLGCPQKPPQGSHVRLTVESHRWGQLDHGNLVGGCKSLLDALTNEGFITDDKPEFITDSYTQTVDRKNRRTTVTLEWEVK